MSNLIYMNEMYNKEIKAEFLSYYTGASKITYGRIFLKSAATEEMFGKDLYEFNLEEIKLVLMDLTPMSYASSQTHGSIISNYISWAIEKGLRSNNINPLQTVDPDWYKIFVPKRKRYITEAELVYIETICVNAQDYVIPRLIFEGVGGEGWNELRNLKKGDIDFENNELTLFDGKNKRSLKVSNSCIKAIEEAIAQEDYEKKNGLMSTDYARLRRDLKLVDNEYVLRNSLTRTKDPTMPIDNYTIFRRIRLIRDVVGHPFIKAKSIQISGMLDLAKKMQSENGKLKKEHYIEIADIFNLNKKTWHIIKRTINSANS